MEQRRGSVHRIQDEQSITTNVVLADATNMGFAIAAGEEWVADFDLDIGDGLSTTGVQLAITVPSGATLNVITGVMPSGTDTATGVYARRTTTSGTAMNFTTATLQNCARGLFRVSVWVLNSTNAGTVQLQIAQSTSSGTALVLRKGSHMRANRIA